MSFIPEIMQQSAADAVAATMADVFTCYRRVRSPNGRGGRISSDQVLDEKVRGSLIPMDGGVESGGEGRDKTRRHFKLTLERRSSPLFKGDIVARVNDASTEYTVDRASELGPLRACRMYEVSTPEGDYEQTAEAIPDDGE